MPRFESISIRSAHVHFALEGSLLHCAESFFTVILQNPFSDTICPKKVSLKSNSEKPKCMISLEVKWEIIKKKHEETYV